MEKRMNWKERGMWVIRDFDGLLYICNRKPYKNYHDEMDFVWSCEGDFMRLESKNFDDLKPENDPVQVDVIDVWANRGIERPNKN
jgi:hypothetical protein